MKYSLGIIGLGHISEKYKLGLEQSPVFQLVSVCDVSLEAISLNKYQTYAIYQDYVEMIEREHLDYVLISTPPKLHYQMALKCLELNCHVLVEKPGALRVDELAHLYETAKLHHKLFDVIYHWRFGNEVLYLIENLDSLGTMKSIKIQISDPYLIKTRLINPKYYSLEGCWIDSSLNVLSFLDLIIPTESLMIKQKRFQYDKLTHLPYENHTLMTVNEIKITVDIRWRMKKNFKVTFIETDKGLFEVNHTKQSIYLNNEMIYQGNREDRLSTHYINYFNQLVDSYTKKTDSLLLHKIALKNQGKRGNKNG